MSPRTCHMPLIAVVNDEMVPGLARAVVRNGWPWISGRTGRETLRGALLLPRTPLVMVQAGSSVDEAVVVVRFFRAPWRKTPVVVVDARGDGEVEAAMRQEGVFCFLSGTDAEPDAIEELTNAMLADLAKCRSARIEAVSATEESTDDQDHAGRLEDVFGGAVAMARGDEQPYDTRADRSGAQPAMCFPHQAGGNSSRPPIHTPAEGGVLIEGSLTARLRQGAPTARLRG